LLRASINRRRRTGTFNISDLPELDRGGPHVFGAAHSRKEPCLMLGARHVSAHPPVRTYTRWACLVLPVTRHRLTRT
jgi:hypothetical protein